MFGPLMQGRGRFNQETGEFEPDGAGGDYVNNLPAVITTPDLLAPGINANT